MPNILDEVTIPQVLVVMVGTELLMVLFSRQPPEIVPQIFANIGTVQSASGGLATVLLDDGTTLTDVIDITV